MAVDYEKQLWDDLKHLHSEMDRIQALPQGDRKGEMPAFYEKVVNIKGQAGSFNYTLITMIAEQRRKYMQADERTSEHDFTIVRQYIALIQVVLEQQLSGAEGPAAKKVLSALDRLGDVAA